MTCKCHVDESAKGRYNMVLGQYLLTELGLNLKLSENIIEANYGPFKGSTTPKVNLGMYIFKDLNTGKLYQRNFLLMLTPKKYIDQRMNILIQNNCV